MHANEVYPREMHAHKVHTYEMHIYEVHIHKMHACGVHAHKIHVHKLHVYEGFCEDLARQITVAHLFQLQLGFRRCHTWVSVNAVVS
jgi:hypothetical protein